MAHKSKKCIQPAHEANTMHHLADRERHAGDVRFAPGRIVANRKHLARRAKEHFLVRYQSRESNAMNTHSTLYGSARTLQGPFVHGWIGKVGAACRADSSGR